MERVMSEFRYLFRYSFALTPVLAVVIGNSWGGAWTLLNLAYTLGFLGILELVVPDNQEAPLPLKQESGSGLLMSAWLGHFIAWFSLIYGILSGAIADSWLFSAALSTGLCSGSLGIVLAHELIHRVSSRWRLLGQIILWSVGNSYFYIDHLKIHHKYVATSLDSASAKRGESIYRFIGRSIAGQISASYKLEALRLRTAGRLSWGWSNYVVRMQVSWCVFLLLIAAWIPALALALFVQGVFACLLLEYTNYIEHYGLSRQENEKVTAAHSWQSDKVISRFFLFDLSRHADHHYRASRPFHQLRSHADSPKQPLGYASSFFPALIPPIWFKIMHKALKRWNSGLA